MGSTEERRREADGALLEKIRQRDEDAFREFVERFGDRLYGFGLRMCGEREDARDVVQETLLQAYRSVGEIKEPKALRSWLYRVASNACLMKRRKGKFEPARELSLDELMPAGVESATFEIPDASSLPDESLARNEIRSTVQEAIGEVPPLYRIVLLLRDIEQLSTRETAEALGLPETTIKMRLHRARLAVRKSLERRMRGGEAQGSPS